LIIFETDFCLVDNRGALNENEIRDIFLRFTYDIVASVLKSNQNVGYFGFISPSTVATSLKWSIMTHFRTNLFFLMSSE
jgi:hypothetical protein